MKSLVHLKYKTRVEHLANKYKALDSIFKTVKIKYMKQMFKGLSNFT